MAGHDTRTTRYNYRGSGARFHRVRPMTGLIIGGILLFVIVARVLEEVHKYRARRAMIELNSKH